MKVRIEMEIDLGTGEYDVRFHNLTDPGGDVEVATLPQVVARVLQNVADNSHSERPRPAHGRKPVNN